jgi:hypothetical protein
MQKYIPQPIPISTRDFSDELIALIEVIAENVHEVWAAGRINEGWKLGEKRNDVLKEHPSLIPYNLLSESEKEYDRRTVIASLSSLISFGYEIKKK